MDAQQADLLRAIDPKVLGQRLRAARVAAGMTQGQAAADDVTVGYVSRIEAGQRRPNAKVLELLAARLDTSLNALLLGMTTAQADELRLNLDFAELALESGDPEEALQQTEAMLGQDVVNNAPSFRLRAHYLRGRALEACGRLDEAILELEPLVRSAGHEAFWLLSAIALTRCYRESGDLGRSVATGERALERLAEQGLADSDEAIQLSVTVAAAYFAQGDTGYAVRLCMQALERAEGVGSPKARAAAYWNASVMESLQGSVAAAIPLAERALDLLGEGQDARNLARLRSQLGVMQLQLDPPEEELALRNLQQAGEELAACSASSIDIGRNDVATARALFLHGSVEEARALAEQTFAATRDTAPLLAADARALAGQAAAAQGDIDYARAAYRDAVFALTGIGADRSAAELWLELGGLLEEVGDAEAARDAYRSAAVSSGVRARSAVSARV